MYLWVYISSYFLAQESEPRHTISLILFFTKQRPRHGKVNSFSKSFSNVFLVVVNDVVTDCVNIDGGRKARLLKRNRSGVLSHQ